MPMTLAGAKPTLENDLKKMLKEAYIGQFSGDGGQVASFVQKQVDDSGTKFADAAAGPVADAIYKYLLEMNIAITVGGTIIAPPMPPALPGGPGSGPIPPTDVKLT